MINKDYKSHYLWYMFKCKNFMIVFKGVLKMQEIFYAGVGFLIS